MSECKISYQCHEVAVENITLKAGILGIQEKMDKAIHIGKTALEDVVRLTQERDNLKAQVGVLQEALLTHCAECRNNWYVACGIKEPFECDKKGCVTYQVLKLSPENFGGMAGRWCRDCLLFDFMSRVPPAAKEGI